MDVTHSIFDLNACLSINLFLEHSVGSIWIVDIALDLFFGEISVYQFDLSGNFILDSDFIFFLKLLLFEKDITDFFAEVEVEISFHSGFWFILNRYYTTG